ncbi:MAG: hypothetical protein ABIW81_03000 [Terrimesophilobacter sp.]
MAGTLILFLLPTVVGLGIGLIWIGLLKKRFGLVLGGVAFPVAVGIVGLTLRTMPIHSADTASALSTGMAPLDALSPYGFWLGLAVFLIAVLPACVKTTFAR